MLEILQPRFVGVVDVPDVDRQFLELSSDGHRLGQTLDRTGGRLSHARLAGGATRKASGEQEE